MNDQERSERFFVELNALVKKWGVVLSTAYSHNIDGLTVAGNAKLSFDLKSDWTPPAPELSAPQTEPPKEPDLPVEDTN